MLVLVYLTFMKPHGFPWLINYVLYLKFDLIQYVIAFVKDQGSNLLLITTTLHSIVDCQPLKL
jgi:hypothetical protein